MPSTAQIETTVDILVIVGRAAGAIAAISGAQDGAGQVGDTFRLVSWRLEISDGRNILFIECDSIGRPRHGLHGSSSCAHTEHGRTRRTRCPVSEHIL